MSKFERTDIGDVTLYNGDCLNIMPTLADGSVDAVICDLPYGTTACKWDVVIPFEPLWTQFKRIVKPNGAVVLFASEPFASYLRTSNLDWYKYDWVWDKRHPTGQLNAKKQPLRQHELICVFYKEQCIYNPIMHENRLSRSFVGKVQKSQKMSDNYGQQYDYISAIQNDSKSYPRSIITQTSVIGNSKEKVAHPTQKPVALMEYLIKTYTNEGDCVLDCTMGSGSTMVACANTWRRGIVIELMDEYYNIAVGRVKQASVQLKLDL